jgi:multimeric flavodoxin WrbA
MQSIKLLGLSGSPRDGATAFVVRQALSYAASLGDVETEFISLKGKKIEFCIHCDYCVRTKQGCVFKDDVSELYPSLETADAWLLATPVYQGTLSGQLKAVLDRCRAVVARNPQVLKHKAGAAIAVGGDRSGGQEPAILTIHTFYLVNQMIPVGGGAFGANLGGTVWSQDQGAEGAEADQVGMKTARRTVKHLVEIARLLKGQTEPPHAD